jgi:hypothetical protein
VGGEQKTEESSRFPAALIHFTRPTVKMLIERLQAAYAKADLQLVRRISALLDVPSTVVVLGSQVPEFHYGGTESTEN